MSIIAMPSPDSDDEHSIHDAGRWALRLPVVYRESENLPPEQKGAIRWLDAYAREHNLTRAEIGAKLVKPSGNGKGYGPSSVYNYMTGRSEGELDNFVSAILAFKKSVAVAAPIDGIFPFVETALSKSIYSYCESTIRHRKIGSIFGDNQVGKTRALRYFAETLPNGEPRPAGDVILIRMPTYGVQSDFVAKLGRAYHMSSRNQLRHLKIRLFELITPNTTLILDDWHQCFWGSAPPRLRTVELVREIHDECGCPIIVVGTKIAYSGMYEEKEHLTFFGQFRNRGLEPYLLRNQSKPTKNDLTVFARKVGLPPAEGEALTLQTVIIEKHGLGKWLTYLMTGQTVAKNAGHDMTWADVLTADATFNPGKKADQ